MRVIGIGSGDGGVDNCEHPKMARSRARSPAPAPAQASRASASIQIRITEIRDGRETARWCPPSPIISRVVACHPPRHPTPSTPEHLNLTFVPRRAPVPPAVRHPLGACQSRGAPGPHRRRSTSLPAVRTQEQGAPRSWRGQRAESGILLAVCFCRKAFLRSTLVPLPLINARDFD